MIPLWGGEVEHPQCPDCECPPKITCEECNGWGFSYVPDPSIESEPGVKNYIGTKPCSNGCLVNF